MLDGRWRTSFEKGLRPVGVSLRRTGITADHLTALGALMSVFAAVAIGLGYLALGFALLLLTAVPDVLDGAVAKASGMASPRGAFFDSVMDRVSDAFLLGGTAWYLAREYGGYWPLLPMAVLAALMSFTHAIATHVEGIGMWAWRNDDGSWVPFFPNARILVPQRELDAIDRGEHPSPGAPGVHATARCGVLGGGRRRPSRHRERHARARRARTRPVTSSCGSDSGDQTAVMVGHVAVTALDSS